jgi:hypothetical protein
MRVPSALERSRIVGIKPMHTIRHARAEFYSSFARDCASGVPKATSTLGGMLGSACFSEGLSGGPCRSRTYDQEIKSLLLYQLS